MKNTEDKATGRPLIDGKFAPINGGIFRRTSQSGITVDQKDFEKFPWFAKTLESVEADSRMWMGLVTAAVELYMPLDERYQKQLQKHAQITDSFNLALFVKNEKEQAKGVFDAQVLFAAMLVEAHGKKNKGSRNVSVIKDPTDGHATVVYQSGKGDIYKYDPLSGDTKFVNLSKANP